MAGQEFHRRRKSTVENELFNVRTFGLIHFVLLFHIYIGGHKILKKKKKGWN